ncbi:DrmE family protein [Clostridium gasigenes]|uniref:DrmE family protein n=1 Tax=Clostridium gasigenes TaxID=94869 RepID=UPI001C0E493F|nr:DrmE family protein [Clostridium gasigenes]MBU3109481.1 DrmE family protein [Clostridium gasigenes]
MDIKNIIANKIFIKDRKIKIDGYTKEVIDNIKKIANGNGKCNLLMTVDEIDTQVLLLVIIATKYYYETLYNNTNESQNSFKIGDIVCYGNKKVEYLGVETIKNEKKIKLRYKDRVSKGVIYKDELWIRVEDYNKLTPYFGEAQSLNIMEGESEEKIGCKELFSEMVNETHKEYRGKVNEQVLFVFESKNNMRKLLSKIYIEVNGVKYNFTKIFPCKYFSDEEKTENFNTNTQREEELFLFTSRLDVAHEILLQNVNCRKIILLGEKSYEKELGGIIERMISRLKSNKIENIIIYNSFNCTKYTDELLNKDLKLYAWCKSYIKGKSNCLNEYIGENKILEKMMHSSCTNMLIEDLALNKYILNIRRDLIKLLKSESKVINNEKLLKVGFKMLKILSEVSIPIKIYEGINEKNDMKMHFNLLEEILEENKNYMNNIEFITKLINNFKEIYGLLYFKNPKIDILRQIAGENSIIICRYDYEKEFLQDELRDLSCLVVTLKEFYNMELEGTLIFTTFFNNDKIDQLGYRQSNNIYNIHYYSDAIKYNYKVSEFNKCMDNIVIKNELQNEFIDENIELIKLDLKKITCINKTNIEVGREAILALESEKINNIEEELIEKYIERNLKEVYNPIFNVDIITFEIDGKLNCNNKFDENNGVSKVIKKLVFDGKRYSMITPYYNALCKNKMGDIVIKSVDSLIVGDKIIFTNNKSEEDLKDLFNKIINSEIFRNQYKYHYDNIKFWKKILVDYRINYNMDYSLLSKEFLIYKINKTDMAIRAWLTNEKIIGPRDKETYEAIAKITRHKRMENSCNDIFESCNVIRSFRTQFKKNFDKMVKNSFIGVEDANDELENLVRCVFKDLKVYADLMEIREIEDIREMVPYNRTNSIIKEKDNKRYGGI